MRRINIKRLAAALILTLALTGMTACGGDTVVTDENGNVVTTVRTDADGNVVTEASQTDADGNIITTPPQTDAEGNIITTAPPTDKDGNVITTTPDPTKPIEVKAGFIYGDSADNSTMSELFETARLQTEKALGVETCYIENVLVQDFQQAVETLQAEGCNVIVSCSNKFSSVVEKLSKADKTVTFISFGGQNCYSNLSVYEGQIYQPAYVCGLVGAFNSVSNRLGVVLDTSMFAPYATANAYILGAKELTGDSTDVRLNYASSESEKQIESAIDNLSEQGCDVIFVYQSTDYAAKYCEKLGIRVIAFGASIPDVAPNTYLTGIFYNLNTYLIDRIRLVQYQSFKSDNNKEGIKSGTVHMLDLSANCKEGTKDITDVLYEFVKDGKAGIFSGEIRDNTNTVKIEKGVTLTHTNIIAIQWLEKSVTQIENYITPKTLDEIVSTDFTIHY